MSDLFRVYWDPAEIAPEGHPYAGYPWAWFEETQASEQHGLPQDGPTLNPPIKDLIRDLADHRCVRCGHPYRKGDGEWSACDERCTHGGPLAVRTDRGIVTHVDGEPIGERWHVAQDVHDRIGSLLLEGSEIVAQWRILTVHHLNGVKHDCRWWNLTSLCQRCHLTIQGKVHLERPWRREHSDWFKPYVAGFYAWSFLGEELDREQTMARLDELLALEHVQMELT